MLQVAANEFLIVNKHQPEDSVLKSPRNDSAEGMKELSVIDPPKEASNTLAADTVEENKVEVVKESQKPVVPIVTDLETVMKPMEDLINILLKHESQQRCGVFGFGARIGGCRYPIFPLNQNERHPALKSKEEAKEVLTKLTEHLVPEEPTKLSPVIQRAIIMCKHQDRHKSYKVYTLLVILTDGEIADTQDTVDSIVEASNFPISIVFVGLKGSNYDVLDYLNTGQDKTDAKKTALKNPQEPQKNEPKKNLSRLTDSKGKMGVRKVTTLVNYTPFKDNLAGLEDAILKAIPLQMMQYYNLNKEIQERRNLLTVSMSDDKLGSDASGRNSPGLPSPVAPKSETTTEERALESPVKTDP